MVKDRVEIHMLNPPTNTSSVEYWSSYGFTCPGCGTTNGDLRLLVGYYPQYANEIIAFAEYCTKHTSNNVWDTIISELKCKYGTKV